jgi:hypothetical protein
LTNRREQIQQIVEDVLQEGIGGGILAASELGAKDLFSGKEIMANKLYDIQRRISLATRYGLPTEAIRALESEKAAIESAFKSGTIRTTGRALGVGKNLASTLGKGAILGTAFGLANTLASRALDKFTNDFYAMGTEKQQISIPDLPEYGLEINR